VLRPRRHGHDAGRVSGRAERLHDGSAT
jgi:hypothetical protein